MLCARPQLNGARILPLNQSAKLSYSKDIAFHDESPAPDGWQSDHARDARALILQRLKPLRGQPKSRTRTKECSFQSRSASQISLYTRSIERSGNANQNGSCALLNRHTR